MFTIKNRFCRLRIRLFCLGLFLIGLLLPAQKIQAQFVNTTVPTLHYSDVSMYEFNRGQFIRALEGFNTDLKNMVKIPNANGIMVPWVDCLCYTIMIGECQYQMGRYDEAMKSFNNAVQIFVNNQNWLLGIDYSNAPEMILRPQLPWGTSTRKGGLGNFKNCRFTVLQENIQLLNLGRQGTALMQQFQTTSIHANEIVTKIALLIRRRAEILGTLSKYDPLTKEMSQILGAKPCKPNHFTGAWVETLYGLTLSAMGDDLAAAAQLDRSLLMQGMFDHQLTPYALNELANIALRAGKPKDAINHYFEASLCATYYADWALLGETFRNMANAQKLVDKTKTLPAFPQAFAHFKSINDPSPLVFVPICHEMAEDAAVTGNIKTASELCTLASAAMSKRAIGESIHGARNHYLRAMITYMAAYADATSGKPLNMKPGDEHLATALTFMRRGSLWLYQLFGLETLFQQGAITARGPITMRIADELYENLLRDPSNVDWSLMPMDCLAQMTFAPPSAYQRWFYVALQRGDREKAFNISELARRANFYSSFSLGPRLFSLRMLFEGHSDDIDQEMLLQRQTLALDFTRFGELSAKVAAVKKQLLMLPILPKDKPEIDKQKQLLAELDRLSLQQEAMLRPIALTRNKAPNSFPPVLTLEQIRADLPENTSMLVYFEALGTYYGFLVDKRNLSMWPLLQGPREPSLQKLVTDFLEGLGNRGTNHAVPFKEIADPDAKWKKTGFELLKRLLGEQRPANFTELVIVPTGPLWYVPFEATTVRIDGDYRPLISAGAAPLAIRYAPTAALGVPKKTSRSLVTETLVLHGKFQSKDDAKTSLEAIDRYTKDGVQNLIPMATLSNDSEYRDLPGSATAFATQIKQLVVLEDTPSSRTGEPLAWTPFSSDKQKLNFPISSWLMLPWGGPQLIVLPGFHTAAENSLKASGGAAAKTITNGDDLFLSSMVFEACGAKTILISRWRTGGRASYDLVGEFLKNYQTMTAADAWRNAIIEVGGSNLVLEEEPRIRIAKNEEEVPVANHPFFWGAFLLVDRGEKPDTAQDATEEKSKLD